jgi:MFS family permease
MGAELVPKEHLGRWMGMQGLFRGLISVPAPILGGWIWDFAGPHHLFVTAIGLDVLIRIPLLLSMPETLGGRFNVELSSQSP